MPPASREEAARILDRHIARMGPREIAEFERRWDAMVDTRPQGAIRDQLKPRPLKSGKSKGPGMSIRVPLSIDQKVYLDRIASRLHVGRGTVLALIFEMAMEGGVLITRSQRPRVRRRKGE